MQTTELDALVERLSAPIEEETAEEELEAAPLEETAEEAGDEAPPEEEAATDEDAAETEETDAPEQPELYTVKVNGVEKKVTLEELKRSFSGQDYIQQQMAAVAAEKKRAAEIVQTLQAEQQRALAFAQQLQRQGVAPAPTPPDPALAEKDPVAYIKALATFTKQSQAYSAQQAQMQAIQSQQMQMTAAQRQADLQANAERLKAAIPEFADPVKAEAKRSEVLKAGTDYGFSEAELMGVTDARMVQALHDAAQWRKLQANKAQPVKADAPKVVKPAARRPEPPQLQRAKVKEAAKKSGRVEDWIEALRS